MYLDLLDEGYDDIKFMGVNGYAYIDNDYHCMVCDTPDSCSSCAEIRVVPWVQDVQFSFSDNFSEEDCAANGNTWDVANEIIHEELGQTQCEDAGYSWQNGFQITHEIDNQEECESYGYTWFHGECIEFDAEICIEETYACLELVDVWENWDITLRDLVIVNRQGYEVARLNLTYNNPDPNSTCGENYQTIKDLIIGAR